MMFETFSSTSNQMEQDNSVKKLIYSMDLKFAEMSFSRFSKMRANEMLTDNFITSRDGKRLEIRNVTHFDEIFNKS